MPSTLLEIVVGHADFLLPINPIREFQRSIMETKSALSLNGMNYEFVAELCCKHIGKFMIALWSGVTKSELVRLMYWEVEP